MASNTTISEVPSAVNNFYDKTMLKAARPLLVHLNWGQVRDIPANSSEVIKFRRYTLLAANTTALTEGSAPTGKQLAVTSPTATVLQYGDFVQLTDYLQFTTLDPILTEMADLLGQQAGNTLDQVCRDIIVAGTTVQYPSGATARTDINSGMKVALNDIRKVVRTLQGNDAKKVTAMVNPSTGFNTTPIMPAYVGIISHNTHFDLKGLSGWVPVAEYPSNQSLLPGEVGSLDEIRFVLTTNAKTFSSSVTVHATLIIAQDAYGITRISGHSLENIIKPLGSAGSADPLNQVSTSGWKATFVAKILNDNFLARYEHAVSA